MIHKITIRELNTIGNQLPQNSSVRKTIHDQVLEAINAKISYILLNDEDKIDLHLIKMVAASKALEKESNKAKRTMDNPTPYISVQEYILKRMGR